MEKLRKLENGEYELELEFTPEEFDDITKRAEAEGMTVNDYIVKMATAEDGPKSKLLDLLRKTGELMKEEYDKQHIDKSTYDEYVKESDSIKKEITE